MKNVMLSALVMGLLFVSTTGYARNLEKGTIELGGDLDLSITSAKVKPSLGNTTEIDSTSLSVLPTYYVARNIGVGLLLELGSEKSERAGITSTTKETTIGPGLVYNISLNDKTSLKLIGAAVIAKVKESETGGISILDDTIKGSGWVAGPEIGYFISDSVSLNTSLLYKSVSLKGENNAKADFTGVSVGLGLSVYFK